MKVCERPASSIANTMAAFLLLAVRRTQTCAGGGASASAGASALCTSQHVTIQMGPARRAERYEGDTTAYGLFFCACIRHPAATNWPAHKVYRRPALRLLKARRATPAEAARWHAPNRRFACRRLLRLRLSGREDQAAGSPSSRPQLSSQKDNGPYRHGVRSRWAGSCRPGSQMQQHEVEADDYSPR